MSAAKPGNLSTVQIWKLHAGLAGSSGSLPGEEWSEGIISEVIKKTHQEHVTGGFWQCIRAFNRLASTNVRPRPESPPARECLIIKGRFTLHLRPRVPGDSIRAISAVDEMDVGTLPLHTGLKSQVSRYDMDAYIATLFGAWDLC